MPWSFAWVPGHGAADVAVGGGGSCYKIVNRPGAASPWPLKRAANTSSSSCLGVAGVDGDGAGVAGGLEGGCGTSVVGFDVDVVAVNELWGGWSVDVDGSCCWWGTHSGWGSSCFESSSEQLGLA